MTRLRATLVAGAVILAGTFGVPALSGAASSKAKKQSSSSSLLWATVNVCDTKDHPDTVGIRGSMPGNGHRSQRMYMRFQLQYYDSSEKTWHNIGDSGDSGFVSVGSAKYRRRASGRNFTVQPPKTGYYRLRGAVTFEWREGTEVKRRSRRRTTSKRGLTAGSDPRGYSVASCKVSK